MKILSDGNIWALFCGDNATDKFIKFCDKRCCKGCLLRLADKDKTHQQDNASLKWKEIDATSGICVVLFKEKEI